MEYYSGQPKFIEEMIYKPSDYMLVYNHEFEWIKENELLPDSEEYLSYKNSIYQCKT